jgi:hypothetical protein
MTADSARSSTCAVTERVDATSMNGTSNSDDTSGAVVEPKAPQPPKRGAFPTPKSKIADAPEFVPDPGPDEPDSSNTEEKPDD